MTNETGPVIHVVDDDEAVRDSLRMLLESVGHRVGTFATAQEFLDGCDTIGPGCLLLDIRMPGMSGVELHEELIRRGVTMPVVFITGHGDVPMAVAAMRRGAFDFVQKPFRDQALLDVIHRALDHGIAKHDESMRTDELLACIASLSPREREVMDLVVAGKPNKVIAADLGVSQRTVEIHRARVMEKLQAGSLAGLVRMVMSVEDQKTRE